MNATDPRPDLVSDTNSATSAIGDTSSATTAKRLPALPVQPVTVTWRLDPHAWDHVPGYRDRVYDFAAEIFGDRARFVQISSLTAIRDRHDRLYLTAESAIDQDGRFLRDPHTRRPAPAPAFATLDEGTRLP